ncbi:MAG: hypothetical protein VKJ27_04680 [Synechocystis sp.]|nr:hypothetical protein [Synechocystis sp.]
MVSLTTKGAIADVKILRLNAVHCWLLSAAPEITSVYQLVNHDGFWRTGPCARDYSRLFVPSPVKTIKPVGRLMFITCG